MESKACDYNGNGKYVLVKIKKKNEKGRKRDNGSKGDWEGTVGRVIMFLNLYIQMCEIHALYVINYIKT